MFHVEHGWRMAECSTWSVERCSTYGTRRETAAPHHDCSTWNLGGRGAGERMFHVAHELMFHVAHFSMFHARGNVPRGTTLKSFASK